MRYNPPSGAPPVPSPERPVSAGASHLAALASALQQRIIPRLIRAHAAPAPEPELSELTGRPVGPGEVRELVRLVLLPDDGPARARIVAMRQRGVPVEALMLDLLALVARQLGEMWLQDQCTFTDVTVGVGRLQQLLREISPGLPLGPQALPHPLRILLLPSPGEQHTFGLVMVSEFFISAGWDVAGGPAAPVDPFAAVQREWFDVVGFSLASEVHLPRLAPAIAVVRKASLNPHVGVLVGGPLFHAHPGLASEVGADAVAVNGSLAPGIAETLVKTRALPC